MSGSEIDEHLGQRIREARTRSGLSLTALADQIGIKTSQVEVMEAGSIRIASLQLARIAKAVDRPLSWFFAGLPGQDVFDAPRERRSV